MAVYLLHLSPAYKHAKHYLGYADDTLSRVALHRMGKAARLTQVAVEAGCELILARVWPDGDRQLERKLKMRKASPRLCPICQASQFTLDDVEEVPF